MRLRDRGDATDVERRAATRVARDFATAEALRTELEAMGGQLRHTPMAQMTTTGRR